MLENTIFVWTFLVIYGPSNGIYFTYIYGDNLKIRIIFLKYHFQYLLLFNAKIKVHLVSIQSSILSNVKWCLHINVKIPHCNVKNNLMFIC
jgi:hypothetical protein